MIDESTEKEKKYEFRSLTSNKDVEIQPVISQALEFAISDVSETTNVAITGNYGAGKSSVIETFELKKKDKKFIHISLAQYDESKKNELNNREINTIEGKIINQLLHQIEPNSIRKSIFKTLDAESQIDPKKNTVFLFSILLLFLYLNLWTDFIKDIDWLTWTIHPIVRLSALVILFTLFFYGIFYLLKLQRDIGFIKHLSLKSDKIETDIEVFSNESSKVSYFDRYLDDVIYLFKQSEADVIVFEDIERFNDSRIFEKIKELNIVINRKRKVCRESKLVFFYLVKDDLFESQERTKFFDFIIPIVPVVTASNSYDQLSKILKGMELYEELDEKFLFNISLYLDDMRLINNICNEYLTYKESLSTLKLDPEKVFSMIVYKNIFPKDFSLLQKNQGYLYELLHSKDEQIEKRKKELTKKIQSLEENIKRVQEEHLKDEVELYGSIFQIPVGKAVVKVNGKSQAEFSSYREFIMELLKEDSIITSFADFYDAYRNESRTEEKLDSVFPDRNSIEFRERLKNTRCKNILSDLNESLEFEKSILYELSRTKFYNIEDFDSEYSELIKENPQFDIIPFLIRNAYIDETYQDYLTYFYGGTITKEEKEFIRNVISGHGNNYDISLTNIDEIVIRLELNRYTDSCVLNYSLFEHLLTDRTENIVSYSQKLELIFKQEKIEDFLIKFYNHANQLENNAKKEEIHKAFFENWLRTNIHSFKKYLTYISTYIDPLNDDLVVSLLNLVGLESLSEETKVLLTKYIDKNFIILTGSREYQIPKGLDGRLDIVTRTYSYKLPQLTNNLVNLNIKFTNFSTFGKRAVRIGEESLIKVIDCIYNQKLYSLTETNVRFFMNWYSQEFISEDEFSYKNFELINSREVFKPLLDYCLSSEESLLQYVKMYIELSSGKMCDKLSYIEQLLNHDIIFQNEVVKGEKETIAEAIINSIPKLSIEYTEEKFNELSMENKRKLIKNLVVNQKAQVNSYIVLSYFSIHPDFSDPDFSDPDFSVPDGYSDLIDFINQDSNFILNRDMFLKFNEEFQNDFFRQTVYADDLELTIYQSILKVIKRDFLHFNIPGLPDDRLKILIDLKCVKFNADNLGYIRKEYPSMRDYFICSNMEKYLEIEKNVRDEVEIYDLLQNEKLGNSYKLKIIDILDYVSLKDKKFSIELITHILDSKFDINDFSYIISSDYYDNADESIKNKIRELTKEHWDKLINLDNSEISISLCEWLLGLDDIDDSERKNLLKNNLLSNPEMSKYRLYLLGDNLDLFELWEIMNLLSDSDIHAEWIEAFNKLNQNEDVGHNGNQSATVSSCEFNIKLLDYLKKRDLISKKSRPDLKGIVLYGFRSGQIEYQ
ncbi:hypothetical protein [uncultured Streptococcus sp.]|uniref:YobI family P-loop NTPase n=1 Tax=uncultured Streptococcus sp. TaxID=83427 RepID=UPI0028D51304|nr:hypothetical protein [uncultured Streptococcus sp.]